VTTSSGLDGILLIDKEGGWTSHDVVAKVRGITRQRKAGHTGTLDPMATGLVVVCLGQATRLVEYMTAHDKRYTGVIQLGVQTDTDDAEGVAVATATVPALARPDLSALEARFRGQLSQMPPAYSALKVQGKRAYAVARAGGTPALRARSVTVHALSLQILDGSRLIIDVHCGPGTYIRSLARDIGAELGCGGHLSALRRVSAGGFTVEEAVSLDELGALAVLDEVEKVVIPLDEGVLDIPAAIVDHERAALLHHGQSLGSVAPFETAPVARIYDSSGEFVAIGSVDDLGTLKPSKVFAQR
jgi:tRNA pseudouridine55 synthase